MSNQNTLDAMLKQYENGSNTYKKTEQKVYDLKNYFTTYLKEKEKSATKRIRILPTNDSSSPFVTIYGHKMYIDGESKTFVCPKHEKNEECPFCEAREALLATGKDSDKELAKKYSAKKMYVVKIIDRDNESDGPKFWRFNHDYRNTGTLDKIYGVLKAVNKDITDATTGRDLLVMLAKDQNNRTVVQSITHVDPSPLSDDASLAAEWLADNRTWEDVYAIKTYSFLEIIVKGGVPVWDKETKKFIDKAAISDTTESNDLDSELSLGVQNIKSNILQQNTDSKGYNNNINTEINIISNSINTEDNDLPF